MPTSTTERARYADAMSDALRAFESTMKAICDENGRSLPSKRDR